jgi:4-oxalocrotonate tautomerase
VPVINVQLLSGRTSEQKAALIRELAEGAIRALGVPEQSIRVLLTEVEPAHWGVGARSKADQQGESAR